MMASQSVRELIHGKRCHGCGSNNEGRDVFRMFKDEKGTSLKKGKSYCRRCIQYRIFTLCAKCPNNACWTTDATYGIDFRVESLCTTHYYQKITPKEVTIVVDD